MRELEGEWLVISCWCKTVVFFMQVRDMSVVLTAVSWLETNTVSAEDLRVCESYDKMNVAHYC